MWGLGGTSSSKLATIRYTVMYLVYFTRGSDWRCILAFDRVVRSVEGTRLCVLCCILAPLPAPGLCRLTCAMRYARAPHNSYLPRTVYRELVTLTRPTAVSRAGREGGCGARRRRARSRCQGAGQGAGDLGAGGAGSWLGAEGGGWWGAVRGFCDCGLGFEARAG